MKARRWNIRFFLLSGPRASRAISRKQHAMRDGASPANAHNLTAGHPPLDGLTGWLFSFDAPLLDRQCKSESRTLPDFAFGFQGSAMLLYDAIR